MDPEKLTVFITLEQGIHFKWLLSCSKQCPSWADRQSRTQVVCFFSRRKLQVPRLDAPRRRLTDVCVLVLKASTQPDRTLLQSLELTLFRVSLIHSCSPIKPCGPCLVCHNHFPNVSPTSASDRLLRCSVVSHTPHPFLLRQGLSSTGTWVRSQNLQKIWASGSTLVISRQVGGDGGCWPAILYYSTSSRTVGDCISKKKKR